MRPIFGFAVAHTKNAHDAEELASRITTEVYAALRAHDDIQNVDGYVFRISQNVWARYLQERKKESLWLGGDSWGSYLAEETRRLERDEEIAALRREIAYLAKTQREVVRLHYFESQKVNDIARRLGISAGTVKWHLHEAKKRLREGMEAPEMRGVGELGISPIRFSDMGHSGFVAETGDTSVHLSRRLTQNVAYAAYHRPVTVAEIAEQLGVLPVFVEDEVAALEEYGFMEKMKNGRYRTLIYILVPDADAAEAENTIEERYGRILAEQYAARLLDIQGKLREAGVSTPQEDANFLLWVMVPYAVSCKCYLPELREIDEASLAIPRKGGGVFAAFARIDRRIEVRFDPALTSSCGPMTRASETYPVRSWQINFDRWTSRRGWQDNLGEDYESLYRHMTGTLPKDTDHIDQYVRLYEKGYLSRDDRVGVVVADAEVTEAFSFRNNAVTAALPDMTEEMREHCRALDQAMADLAASRNTPPHMQRQAQALCQNVMASPPVIAHALQHMIEAGMVSLPTPEQARTITTLVFADRAGGTHVEAD